jgi:large subunit ribosomal protein L30
MAVPMIRIKLVRSPIGSPEKLRKVVRGLGLKKINSTVERPDTPEIRGMIRKVPHLVAVEQEAGN